MTHKSWFILSILTYTFLSVASQYGSAVPVDLSWISTGLFIPFSALTIIPLLDCSRSFSQGCAERASVPFKISFSLLVIVPLFIALACTMFAGLPISIFLGALFATGVGGFIDVMTFKYVGKWIKEDQNRMAISNFTATVTGSFIFFMIAFTPLLEQFGITNILNKGNYIDPAISSQIQAIVIYTIGVVIAQGTAFVNKLFK